MSGKTNIKSIKSAFAPKNNFNLIGITVTVLSIDSIVIDNLVAKRIKKNNQEILNTNGHRILIIQKFKTGSGVHHNSKSTKLKIRKITIGSTIIEIKTTKRDTIIPLISFVISELLLLYF